MGIVFDTDIMGLQQFKVDERGPVPTAAAMLRDVINLVTFGSSMVICNVHPA